MSTILYGDGTDLELFPVEQQPKNGDYALLKAPPMHNITYHNNTLSGDNAVIYGDIGTVTLLAQGLDHTTEAVTSFYNATNGYIVNFGNDQISVTGASTVYGDVGDINWTAMGGTAHRTDGLFDADANKGADSEGIIMDNTFNFGADKITASSGNDVLYGDAHNISWTALGASQTVSEAIGSLSSSGDIGGNHLNFGADVIDAGNGNNTVYGDMNDLSLLANAGQNSASYYYLGAIIGEGGTADDHNVIVMGNDNITTGTGADTIYGDLHDLSITSQGGIANWLMDADSTVRRTDFTMGNDTISSGDGNDSVYGDLHDLNIVAQGGTADLGLTTLTNGNQVISDASGVVRQITITFGSDTIDAGNGDDTVWGDAHLFNYSAIGGTSLHGGEAEAHLMLNNFTFGADTINGGAGNDTLYGDVESISFSSKNGGFVVGDYSGLDSSPDVPGFTRVDTGSTITFGNDILNGGAGNDTLVGDALNVTNLNLFNVYNNKVIWGNDTLTGGAGADKFEWALQKGIGNTIAMQGDDIVTDFQGGSDKLVFLTGPANAKALDQHTTFSHIDADGGGTVNDTVVHFDGGGSVTLLNTTINSFQSMGADVIFPH